MPAGGDKNGAFRFGAHSRVAVAAQQMISGLVAEFRALASAHAFLNGTLAQYTARELPFWCFPCASQEAVRGRPLEAAYLQGIELL